MRAISFVRNCGATTAFSSQISVLWKEEKFGNEAGNVFDADDDHGAVANMDTQIHWEANNALVIRYPAKARIFLQVVKLGGVSIRYESH